MNQPFYNVSIDALNSSLVYLPVPSSSSSAVLTNKEIDTIDKKNTPAFLTALLLASSKHV